MCLLQLIVLSVFKTKIGAEFIELIDNKVGPNHPYQKYLTKLTLNFHTVVSPTLNLSEADSIKTFDHEKLILDPLAIVERKPIAPLKVNSNKKLFTVTHT